MLSIMWQFNCNSNYVWNVLIVTGEFTTQRQVTRIFDIFFDLRPKKRLSKQSWGWWFETPWGPLWRHCNVMAHNTFGCFTNISRVPQDILWNFVYFINRTSYDNFKPKRCTCAMIWAHVQSFSLKFSPLMWFSAWCIFARLLWRARETTPFLGIR